MEPLPYIPGFTPADSGPLARFLPQLEQGVFSAWLTRQNKNAPQAGPSAWLLDPFGFSPQLVLEAAHSGYRVLVTANNPITRFLLETYANPPSEADFSAALADLSAVKKGEERLGAHLQALYVTSCEKCKQPVQAQAFLWRKDETIPYGRIYKCPHCGDAGEKAATFEDQERAQKVAETDPLHRSRLFERVIALHHEDRIYAEEAIQHYLPRPLYVLTTIVNRLSALNLSTERKRALTALILLACDAGNTLWSYPEERKRPKQLSTPNRFRENNIWEQLERGIGLFSRIRSKVPCEAWPRKIPESGGICIYEGRLSDLAKEVKREIPIAAVLGSIPRPNQAFWTLSALWAGWLWGSEAVEPYKVALRRRRYDWAWNATALHAMFENLNDLLPDGVPMFGLLPEPEPAFLTSALTAAHSAGFKLQSVAARTMHDAAQILWQSGKKEKTNPMKLELARETMRQCLIARGEPVGYFHLHLASLSACAEANSLKTPELEFDEALRKTHALFEAALKEDARFVHYSNGEGVETGLWGLKEEPVGETLADQIEKATVNYLQKNPEVIFLDVEEEVYARVPGVQTPSQGLIHAVLTSYAENDGAKWRLRKEDFASVRNAEIQAMLALLKTLGKRLNYQIEMEARAVLWKENKRLIRKFSVFASAILNRASIADDSAVLVVPGGRAGLIAYKQSRDPALAARAKNYQLVKYRLLRALSEVPVLTRETFAEQIAGDPIEESKKQMMMF
ncbi:MAG: hypothetical protein IT311_02485 [Anaerolineales bacterium]|nr:hypothetical protein [Anaerolineales bacterium]